MKQDPVVIVAAKRTAMGAMQGVFSDATAPQLASTAIKACLQQANLSAQTIEEVIMGCVLQAGQGQAPARQAALGAGLSKHASCTTINKMCGSGMKAVMLAHDLLIAGSNQVMVAGGMENMTNAPYLLAKARSGYRLGHGQLFDHMFLDGLEDAYERGKLMGVYADATAQKYQISRQQQDEFAMASLQRAQQATQENLYQNEIAPHTVSSRQGDVVIATDEGPQKAKADKIPTLRPAFNKDGSVTAANASSISDGAAALILMRRSQAEKQGIKPLAIIHGHSSFAQDPAWFTTAPVGAMEKLLKHVNWSIDQVDLFEINEAFAVVTLVAMQQLEIPHHKVNVYGGACALGHPIGASGARIIVTLLNALTQKNLTRGVASLCIGGGEATAIAIERV